MPVYAELFQVCALRFDTRCQDAEQARQRLADLDNNLIFSVSLLDMYNRKGDVELIKRFVVKLNAQLLADVGEVEKEQVQLRRESCAVFMTKVIIDFHEQHVAEFERYPYFVLTDTLLREVLYIIDETVRVCLTPGLDTLRL